MLFTQPVSPVLGHNRNRELVHPHLTQPSSFVKAEPTAVFWPIQPPDLYSDQQNWDSAGTDAPVSEQPFECCLDAKYDPMLKIPKSVLYTISPISHTFSVPRLSLQKVFSTEHHPQMETCFEEVEKSFHSS